MPESSPSCVAWGRAWGPLAHASADRAPVEASASWVSLRSPLLVHLRSPLLFSFLRWGSPEMSVIPVISVSSMTEMTGFLDLPLVQKLRFQVQYAPHLTV